MDHDLCLPFFCSNCHHLAFILKRRNADQPEILEYGKSGWEQHLCYKVKGKEIWSHAKNLENVSWGVREIPLQISSRARKSKPSKLTIGVVISLPESGPDKQSQSFAKVLTIEGSLINIRTVHPQAITSAGILIDLTNAKKVGSDRYRLAEIIQVDIKALPSPDKETISDYFKISLSSYDQEQLEVYIERFLEDLSSHNLFPVSIIPLPNTDENQQTRYSRQIAIPPSSSLQKTIENMTIPHSIRLSIA